MENGNSYPGIRIDKLDSDTVVRFIDQGNDAVVISGTLNMGSHRIVKGADPVDGKDFATKDYVDQISGLVEGSDVDSVNGLTGSLVIAGASGISVSDNDVDTITITGPDLSSFATISALNSVSGTLQSQIDGLTFDLNSVEQDVSDLQTGLSSLGSELVTVSGHLQEQIDVKSDVGHSHAHTSLSGLSDDDHIQYVPTNGSRGFTSVVSGTNPVMDFHLATKAYVDGAVFSLREELLSVSGSLQFEIDQLRNELVAISGSCCSGVAAFPAQYFSIDQLGDSENLAKATAVDIGIGNVWSISMWINPNSSSPTSGRRLIEILPSSGGENGIMVFTTTSPTTILVNTIDSTNTNLKLYNYNSVLTANTWSFLVLTWNGSNLKFYHQGSQLTPDTVQQDNSGTMSSTNRSLGLGGRHAATPADSFDGRLHSYAIWNTDLSANAISELYNSGNGAEVDYASDGINYTASSGLLHWWRLGFDENDIGKDYGNHTTLIDVMDSSTGIDASDIVNDYPGM